MVKVSVLFFFFLSLTVCHDHVKTESRRKKRMRWAYVLLVRKLGCVRGVVLFLNLL